MAFGQRGLKKDVEGLKESIVELKTFIDERLGVQTDVKETSDFE